MPLPPTIIPVKPRIRRRRRAVVNVVPPLVLVSAGYEPDVPSIDLLFERDIDFSGIDVSAFTVADGVIAMCTWVGTGSYWLGSRWVQVLFTRVGDFSGPGTLMTVGAGNGIVAVEDGGAWAGVAGMGLPWP